MRLRFSGMWWSRGCIRGLWLGSGTLSIVLSASCLSRSFCVVIVTSQVHLVQADKVLVFCNSSCIMVREGQGSFLM